MLNKFNDFPDIQYVFLFIKQSFLCLFLDNSVLNYVRELHNTNDVREFNTLFSNSAELSVFINYTC